MNNSISNDNEKNDCTGCQVCAALCPVHAIKIEVNTEGFYSPIVTSECINCGKCRENCYKFNDVIKNEECIEAYAAWSKDGVLRSKSSSGGVAEVILSYLIDTGYEVFGVAYDLNEEKAKTIIIDKKDQLYKLRGSKYMQSFSEEALQKVISSNKKYAVIGTPCMIYALKKWSLSENKGDKFVFIDFFCHGTPSLYLWKSYIKKYNKIDNIIFRSKKYGWHEFCNEFIYKKKKIVSKKTHEDPFFELFFSNEVLNEACYSCKIRDTLEYCDIRIGDFWGKKYMENTLGVSALIIATYKGKKIIDNIKPELMLETADYGEIINPQAFKIQYTYSPSLRYELLGYLRQGRIKEAFLFWKRKLTFKQKIMRQAKIFISKLPFKIQIFVKKIYSK